MMRTKFLFSFCSISDEPKLNPGSWEDPLPRTHNATIVNYNGITNNTRRSTDLPLTTTCLNNRHNNNLSAKQFNLNNATAAVATLGNNTNNRRRLEHTPSARTISSEESWCSEGVASDRELSSDEDDESDRSISSSTPRNSQLRLTFNKAKQHLSFDKWRNNSNNNITTNNNNPSGSLNSSNSSTASSNNTTMPSTSVNTESPVEPFSRLSRWFSMRRGSTHQQYDLGSTRDSRDLRAGSVDHVDNSDVQAANRAATISSNKMPQLNEVTNDIIFKLLPFKF